MDLLDKSLKAQRWIEDNTGSFGKGKYGRVLKMSRKPDAQEFRKTIIITGIGMALIGGLGFIIWIIWEYLPGYLWKWLELCMG